MVLCIHTIDLPRLNLFKPVQQSRQQGLKAYCSNIYTVFSYEGGTLRIELQTTILQLEHPSFWQHIKKGHEWGQIHKSEPTFPLLTKYLESYCLRHTSSF